jgi:hypothetical protein
VITPHTFTLGRTIDKDYLPNRLIIIITTLTFIFGIIFHFFQENNFIVAISYGIFLALATFFTWALSREVYPQGEYSALVATIISTVCLAWFGFVPVIFLILLWLIMCLRLINQTTGLNPLLLDRLIILILTIFTAYFLSWIFLLFMVIMNIINYKISKEKIDMILILLGFISGIILIIFQGIWYNQSVLTYQNGFIISIILIVFLVMMWIVRNFKVESDFSKKQVPPIRIFSGQFMSILFCSGYILWFGDDGIVMLLPLWCIILSSIISSGEIAVKEVKKSL